jgi:hypothetical protein
VGRAWSWHGPTAVCRATCHAWAAFLQSRHETTRWSAICSTLFAVLCCPMLQKKSVKRIFFISSTLYVVPYPKKILSNKTNYQNSEKPRQYPKGAFISKLFASIVFCCWFPPLVLAYLPPSKFKLNFSVLKVETYAAEFLATGICREFPKVLQWLSGMYHLPKDDPVVCFVPFVLFFFFPFSFTLLLMSIAALSSNNCGR